MPETDKPPGDLPPLRDVIARYGLAAKKSLGQNFLLDLNLTRRIARAVPDLANSTIYEVGPGPGGLTRALLAEGAAHVIAVERDDRCIPALEDIANAYPGRLTIAPADALALDETKLIGEYGGGRPVQIAANLPYNIGSALLVKWLTNSSCWPSFWQSLTLMFQREVALRLVAEPGTHAYGRLSVLTGWRANPRILFDISPSAFTPPPKVTSSVVQITPLSDPVADCALSDLERVTAAAFGQRRKMLRQSLKTLVPDAETFVMEAELDPTLRAERLSIADFAALARRWAELAKKD
ncbi:MAG TPA: 16S rRNA (adenine(1518)-N(6)/adenine(1519)-N(6))-dimethyltransferase RsmA [Rhizomicrobium sp.]|nr:16S rRNA (adenine(1518)-N(6)/adenine(1519)-N(6))-dimethyltransferase RsmA [Rhizomicrobium sp.]